MLLYHGSCVGGLTQLKPFLSEHGKAYVYLSSNPVVALLYAVKPVPKPFSFYPYGFDSGKVIYSEYFEDCFKKLYQGKTGFLYECEVAENAENATAINCAYTTESPVKVCKCIEIKDIYEKFAEYRKEGLFDIKPFDRIPEKEMTFVLDDMRSTIEKYGLKNDMNNPMSKFIAENFPMLWN
ncbi:MAG: hypothetical protein IJE14_08185 [Clostridia bacterium]|nr:hypothetical protein [Clostridia bacterium]